jgi:hypothetical protein
MYVGYVDFYVGFMSVGLGWEGISLHNLQENLQTIYITDIITYVDYVKSN